MVLGKLAEKIRPFDAFSKTLDEIRIQTFSGGIVTIICSALMFLLFLSELHHYQTLKVAETLFVSVANRLIGWLVTTIEFVPSIDRLIDWLIDGYVAISRKMVSFCFFVSCSSSIFLHYERFSFFFRIRLMFQGRENCASTWTLHFSKYHADF